MGEVQPRNPQMRNPYCGTELEEPIRPVMGVNIAFVPFLGAGETGKAPEMASPF